MCMLIHHSKKSHLTHAMLQNFLKHNPDGFGFAYGDGKKLHVVKVPTPDFKTVADLYGRYVRGRNAIVHFRMRTHGDVNDQNTHPYRVTDDLYMAHNGVLQVTQRDRAMSDTWHLIEDYIRPQIEAHPDLWRLPAWQDMLGRMIGSSNKLGFVHRSGKVAVINPGSGITHANTWFSNVYAWDPEQFGVEGLDRGYVWKGKTYYPATTFPTKKQDRDTAAEGKAAAEESFRKLSKRERKAARRAAALEARGKSGKPMVTPPTPAKMREAMRGGTRGLVLPVDSRLGSYKGEVFDKAWLRTRFRDRATPETAAEREALRILREDMAPRD